MLVNYCVQVGNYVVNQHKIVTRNNKEIVRRNAARPESHPSEKFLVMTNMRVSVSSINFWTHWTCCQQKSCLRLHGWWMRRSNAVFIIWRMSRGGSNTISQLFHLCCLAVSYNLFNRHAACVPPDRWKVNKTGQKFSLDQLQYFHEMYRLYRIYSVYSFNFHPLVS